MNSDLSLSTLRQMGEDMGLSGEFLLNFVEKQQALARDERAADRAEKEKIREHELRMVEAKNSSREFEDFERARNERCCTKFPNLPPYDETEELPSYLVRYERIASLRGWSRDDWAT